MLTFMKRFGAEITLLHASTNLKEAPTFMKIIYEHTPKLEEGLAPELKKSKLLGKPVFFRECSELGFPDDDDRCASLKHMNHRLGR